ELAITILKDIFPYSKSKNATPIYPYYMEQIAQQRLDAVLKNAPMPHQQDICLFEQVQWKELQLVAKAYGIDNIQPAHSDFFSLTVSAPFSAAKSLSVIERSMHDMSRN